MLEYEVPEVPVHYSSLVSIVIYAAAAVVRYL